MSALTYREAVAAALASEMDRDDTVFLMGEDVAAAGGVFKATSGLIERFGPERVRDTPISETAITGCAIGAAVTGMRPVVEVMFADFAGVCFDQIANQLPKYRYMTGGQVSVPVTVRLVNGSGNGFGAQHSQAVENWFLNVPGLKIAVPATSGDLYGLLRSAIRDDDPVLVFEHKGLYGIKGEAPADDALVPLGRAEIVRDGSDVTIVATQLMRYRSLAAAERLASEGIGAEVIDLRTLVPMDTAAVASSVARTNRLVCVQEAPVFGGWAAALVAALMEGAFDDFDAPPRVVGGDATPIPYAGILEAAWLPDEDRIAGAVREVLS